jgi:hypothetical protein
MIEESQRVFIFSILGPSVVDVFFESAFNSLEPLRHRPKQLHGAPDTAAIAGSARGPLKALF